MKKITAISLMLPFCLAAISQNPAKLPVRMEELTSPQFVKAVELSKGVCVIPMGIIEKHATQLPLGSDLYEARAAVEAAVTKEYAVVFPPYYFGQIFEARHQPGTVAYLQETCEEMARNGLKKIILFSGHGGNNAFLQFFCQSQLASEKDYIVVLFQPGEDPVMDKEIQSLKKASNDGHAGEEETSMIDYIRPDLVDRQALGAESGADQARLALMKNGYVGIWWYAKYPNHYAGDLAQPNKRLGELLIEKDAGQLAGLIRYLKDNNEIERLQNEFYDRASDPLKNK
jgi:creatinine amidohydrolase